MSEAVWRKVAVIRNIGKAPSGAIGIKQNLTDALCATKPKGATLRTRSRVVATGTAGVFTNVTGAGTCTTRRSLNDGAQ